MKRFLILSCLVLAAAGCIPNDLDYPVVYGGFTSFEVEGAKSVEINKNTHVITLELEEGTDKDHVKVKGYTLSEMSVPSKEIPEYLDLTEPFEVTLTTYQKYEWKIVANQTIVRYVTCDKQAGDAAFNEKDHSITLYVTEDQPLSSINFTDMKLGPEGSDVVSTTGYESSFESTQVVSREMHFPITLNCVLERTFDVVFKDKTTTWTLKAVQIAVTTEVKSVVAWCHKADVRGVFSGSGTASLEYRKRSETSWRTVRDAKVAGVGISATIKGLSENTDYLVRVREDDDTSEEVAFHTDSEQQVYNMNFDSWHQEGKIWFPFPETGENPNSPSPTYVWDTANKATGNFLGSSNTTPDPNFVCDAGRGAGKNSVRMESVSIPLPTFDFAGGNIYVGQFAKLSGFGCELHHGVPFTSKPTSLHGWYCYMPTTVDHADEDHSSLMGQEDIGQLQCYLSDWDEQFVVWSVKTKDHPQRFIESYNEEIMDEERIIAYFNLMLPSTNGQWVEFDFPIQYRNYRQPKFATIISASSYYANYYTGGTGSILWLDELDFRYN